MAVKEGDEGDGEKKKSCNSEAEERGDFGVVEERGENLSQIGVNRNFWKQAEEGARKIREELDVTQTGSEIEFVKGNQRN